MEESIQTFSQRFKLLLGVYPDEFSTIFGLMGYNEALSLWMTSSTYGTYITIPNPEKVDEYMRQLGIEDYKWNRRDGEPVVQKAKHTPIRTRPLYSIQPILDLVCGFFGAEQNGLSREETAKAERRLGISFPAPLLECYLQAPPQLRAHPDSLLNGFLAAELFWNAMNQEKLGVVLTELSECSKRVFGAKNKLGRFLSPVGKELTKGSTRFLFAAPDHKILALYDDEIKNAYLASVGAAPLKQLEKDARVTLSWL